MKKLLLLSTCLLSISAVACAGPKKAIVAFYNVENLFDTIDDPHINDNEFLPDNKKAWDTKRYAIKLNNLSKVITSISPDDLPWIMGLCEVENRNVIQDLVNTEKLKSANYQIVHRDSPDPRGIDVAAIYRKDKFTLLEYHYYPISYDSTGGVSKTREILHLKGILFGKDTVHLFFNHWPSRVGGEEKTNHKREAAALKLREKTDSLYLLNKNVKIIIMGDLNDHPTDPNVKMVLGAKKESDDKNAKLINLFYEEQENKTGTHSYKNEWGVLDNIIVSSGLLNSKKGIKTKNENAIIHKQDWMMYTDKNGNQSPAKSFSSTTFHEDGCSDHLPVYLILNSK